MSRSMRDNTPSVPKTGWLPGLLQDDCRGLSKWLANRVDSRKNARKAVEKKDQIPDFPGFSELGG